MKDELSLDRIERLCSEYAEKAEDVMDSRALYYFLGQVRNLMFIDVREGKELVSKKPKNLSEVFDIYAKDNLLKSNEKIAKILFYKNGGEIKYLGHYMPIPTYFMDFVKESPIVINDLSKYGLIEMYYNILNSSKISAYQKGPMLESVIKGLNKIGKVNVFDNGNILNPKFVEQTFKSTKNINAFNK